MLRYCDDAGATSDAANFNGSLGAAAGVISAQGNVFGLMPHPERAADDRLPSRDGRVLIESVVEWIRAHGGAA